MMSMNRVIPIDNPIKFIREYPKFLEIFLKAVFK